MQFSHFGLDMNTATFFGSPHDVTAQQCKLDNVPLPTEQDGGPSKPSASIGNLTCSKHDRTPATLCKDLRSFIQSLEVNPETIEPRPSPFKSFPRNHPSVVFIWTLYNLKCK
jgi:hypothetical protein